MLSYQQHSIQSFYLHTFDFDTSMNDLPDFDFDKFDITCSKLVISVKVYIFYLLSLLHQHLHIGMQSCLFSYPGRNGRVVIKCHHEYIANKAHVPPNYKKIEKNMAKFVSVHILNYFLKYNLSAVIIWWQKSSC